MVGEYAWDCIKKEFEKGKITPEKMNCIADMLGPTVSEKHAKRSRCDETEMKAILNDWDFFDIENKSRFDSVRREKANSKNDDPF